MIERAHWPGVLCLTLALALAIACGSEAPETEESVEDVTAPAASESAERPNGVS